LIFAAVIRNLNELFSARFHADFDPRRPRVERVLEHLLDDRCRPLHHLAGGDLVGDLLRKYVNAAHALKATWFENQTPVSQMRAQKQSRLSG
jgi:hypothetical protein